MECPVCKNEVNTEEGLLCPECMTDLEIFESISCSERRSRRLRWWATILTVIIVLLLALAFAAYFFILKDQVSKNTEHEALIQEQSLALQRLETENQRLSQAMLEMGSVKDSLEKIIQTQQAQVTAQSTDREKTAKNNTTVQPASTDIIHIVKPGESLQSLALRYYGDKYQYLRIIKDNGLKNPDHIWVGQKLKIVKPTKKP